MVTIKNLEDEINRIKERNQKVEADKVWEMSWTRKILIAGFTYLVIAIFFVFTGVLDPFVNAIVPALAFILSTASLPFLKNLWLKLVYKN